MMMRRRVQFGAIALIVLFGLSLLACTGGGGGGGGTTTFSLAVTGSPPARACF